MDTRDSGVIDLFAIHKEEEQRHAPAALPSAPPPAVSFDTNVAEGEDADVDGFAFAQAKSKKKAKIVGGAIGAFAVVGILIAAITSGSGATKEPAAAAAVQPPPPAATETLPAPAATPVPEKVAEPAPPSTAKADDGKPGYSRAAAIAAYKGNAKKAGSAKASGSKGPKLQKIQSSGTN